MDGGDDDDSGYVPIVEAAKRGNDELIQEYIEQGLNPKKVDALGNSALHWAAAGNHVDCINLLLKLGLDPNQPNRDGDTPLHKAAWKNYDEAAAALVRESHELLCCVSLPSRRSMPCAHECVPRRY